MCGLHLGESDEKNRQTAGRKSLPNCDQIKNSLT